MNDISKFAFEPQIPARFTIAEFERLVSSSVFEGSNVELVEGVIIRMSPAMSVHIALQKQIYDKLFSLFPGGRHGLLTYSELTILLGEATLRTIDVAIAGALPRENIYPTADSVFLAIEVANSTLTYDLAEKKRDYARAGIPHYWVVDPDSRIVHVMATPIDDDYSEKQPVAFGRIIPIPGTADHVTIEHPFDI